MTAKNTFNPALIFQSNMVLQRGKSVLIWGSGIDGNEVSVEIQSKKGSAAVVKEKWIVELPPLDTSDCETMIVRCNEKELILNNLCVGEVWVAGGQSNMEFAMRYDEELGDALSRGQNNKIRFFDLPEVSYRGQLEEMDYSKYGVWRTCDAENLEYFSAVGFYFANKLQKDLDVPVGIIGCNWGGTPACSWMKPKYLENNSGKVWLEEYQEAVKNLDLAEYNKVFMDNPVNFRNDIFADSAGEKLMFGMSREEQELFMQTQEYQIEEPPMGPKNPKRPGGLYETMVCQIAPYTINGFLWYQGESDDKHPEFYDTVLSSLILCWRDTWKEELPFLFVQLAPFRRWLHCTGSAYSLLRSKQEKVSKTVPKTWMVSIMDSGKEFDIHPQRKRPVGERLALMAEGKVYGQNILCDSPELSKVVVEDGVVALIFDHTGEGLKVCGDKLNALELNIDNTPADDYSVEISGAVLLLKSQKILKNSSVEIKFANVDYCEVNLYNTAHLSAKPFLFHSEKNCVE